MPSKWVFKSFWIDFSVFVLPIFLAAYGMLLVPNYDQLLIANLTLYGVVHVSLSAGHVFTTLLPAIGDKEIRRIVGRKLWLHPAFFLLAYGILYTAYYRGFIFALAIHGFYHVFAQHQMWLKTLQRREGLSTNRRRFEVSLFLVLTIVPVITWSSGQIIDNPSIFNPGDIALNLAFLDLSAFAPIITLWVFGYISCLIFSFRSDLKAAPWGKIIFFATMHIWLVVGLVYLKSTSFFIVYNVGTHAISYYVYIARGWNSPPTSGLMPRPKAFAVFLLGPIFGAAWLAFWHYGQAWIFKPLLYFQWLHVVVHFALDGVLWRGTNRRVT